MLTDKTNSPCATVKKNTITVVIALTLLFLISATLSWNTGLTEEDIYHLNSHNFLEATSIAIQSYNETNARIGELCLYFLGISDDGTGAYQAVYFFRTMTPLFLTLGALFIYRIGTGQWPTSDKHSIIPVIIIILFLLGNKTGYYWLCSNTNWLFPSVIAMGFFIMIEPFFRGNFNLSWKRIVAIALLTPLVGMSNENTSITSLCLYTVAGIAHIFRNKALVFDKKYISIGLLLLSFTLLYYMAPGPHKRVDSSATESANLFFFALKNAFTPLNWLHIVFWCWRPILISLFILMICPLNTWKTKRNLILACTAFLMQGILTAAPHFGAPRAFIPIELVIFALMAGIMQNALRQALVSRFKIACLFALQISLAITTLFPLAVHTIDSFALRSYVKEKATEALSRGETTLILHANEMKQSSCWNPGFRIPRSLMEFHTPMVPFITTSHYNEAEDYTHRFAVFPYDRKSMYTSVSCGDDILNKGIAKMFGLERIIVLTAPAQL